MSILWRLRLFVIIIKDVIAQHFGTLFPLTVALFDDSSFHYSQPAKPAHSAWIKRACILLLGSMIEAQIQQSNHLLSRGLVMENLGIFESAMALEGGLRRTLYGPYHPECSFLPSCSHYNFGHF